MRCTVLKIRTCVTKYNCCGGFGWKYQEILVILNCIYRNLLSKENFPGPIMGGVGLHVEEGGGGGMVAGKKPA